MLESVVKSCSMEALTLSLMAGTMSVVFKLHEASGVMLDHFL